jgi:hypothetical protein
MDGFILIKMDVAQHNVEITSLEEFNNVMMEIYIKEMDVINCVEYKY